LELTGQRHDNVVRDIEKMLAENEIDCLKFEGVYLDAKGERRTCYSLPKFGDTYTNEQNGQKYRCYNLPKDLTITLVAYCREAYGISRRLHSSDVRNGLPAHSLPLEQITQTVLHGLAGQGRAQRGSGVARIFDAPWLC